MDMKSMLLGAAFGLLVSLILSFLVKGFNKNHLMNAGIGAWGGLVGAVVAAAISGPTTNLVLVFGISAFASVLSMFAVKQLGKIA